MTLSRNPVRIASLLMKMARNFFAENFFVVSVSCCSPAVSRVLVEVVVSVEECLCEGLCGLENRAKPLQG